MKLQQQKNMNILQENMNMQEISNLFIYLFIDRPY